MVGIAQQGDAVGAGHGRAGAFHRLAHGPAADALAIFGLGWRVGLGHQHIAVGQQVEPAWVVEAAGEGFDLRPWRSGRLAAFWPADGGGDVYGGDQCFDRSGEARGWPAALVYAQQGCFAAACQAGCD
ncbi:hypothetical protein D3C80_1345560 [compost metagenome]